MQDSIYNLFSLHENSHPYDIETAGNRALLKVNASNIKEWLMEHNIAHNDSDINDLLKNMKQYISVSASILLDPGLKDCYDTWLHSLDGSNQTVAKARLSYINSQNMDVQFGKECFDRLTNAKTLNYEAETTYQKVEHAPKCRWCKEPFEAYSSLQCKCTARIGHKKCADEFCKEYKNKCPICRSNLLQRAEISKYMFWSVDEKFHIL